MKTRNTLVIAFLFLITAPVNSAFSQKNPDKEEWIKKDGTPLSSGYIALQAESHAIEFRKVELLNLEGCMNPKCSHYKSYYIKSSNTCNCKK